MPATAVTTLVLLCSIEQAAICTPEICWSEFPAGRTFLVNLDGATISECPDLTATDCDVHRKARVATVDGAVVAYFGHDAMFRLAGDGTFMATVFISLPLMGFEEAEPAIETTFGTCAPFGASES
jgi:hypothetical protein